MTAPTRSPKRAVPPTVTICTMVFIMCAGGYFLNLTHAAPWLAVARYLSFWYYSFGLFLANALPTQDDKSAFNTTLERYSFSTWTYDEGKWYLDVVVLLGFAVGQRTLACTALAFSRQLRFK